MLIIVFTQEKQMIAASDEKALKVVKEMLTARFKMMDLGKLKNRL